MEDCTGIDLEVHGHSCPQLKIRDGNNAENDIIEVDTEKPVTLETTKVKKKLSNVCLHKRSRDDCVSETPEFRPKKKQIRLSLTPRKALFNKTPKICFDVPNKCVTNKLVTEESFKSHECMDDCNEGIHTNIDKLGGLEAMTVAHVQMEKTIDDKLTTKSPETSSNDGNSSFESFFNKLDELSDLERSNLSQNLTTKSEASFQKFLAIDDEPALSITNNQSDILVHIPDSGSSQSEPESDSDSDWTKPSLVQEGTKLSSFSSYLADHVQVPDTDVDAKMQVMNKHSGPVPNIKTISSLENIDAMQGSPQMLRENVTETGIPDMDGQPSDTNTNIEAMSVVDNKGNMLGSPQVLLTSVFEAGKPDIGKLRRDKVTNLETISGVENYDKMEGSPEMTGTNQSPLAKVLSPLQDTAVEPFTSLKMDNTSAHTPRGHSLFVKTVATDKVTKRRARKQKPSHSATKDESGELLNTDEKENCSSSSDGIGLLDLHCSPLE